jgi:excisionase family DNA binding protein
MTYTVSAALAATGLGRTKFYEELKSGRLKSFRLCGRRLILHQDLDDWLRAARDASAK